MKRRNRCLIIIGVVICLAGWLAWKVLLTKNTLPSSPPVTQGSER
jgi:hypothetical protein